MGECEWVGSLQQCNWLIKRQQLLTLPGIVSIITQAMHEY